MRNSVGGAQGAFVLGIVAGALVLGVILVGAGGGFGKECPGKLSAGIDEVLDVSRYTRQELAADLNKISYQSNGQNNHPLTDGVNPSTVTASIQRVYGSPKRKASCFDNTPIVVASISATGDFAPLKLNGASTNYFVVWRNTSEAAGSDWHGAMLNDSERLELDAFKYQEHWHTGNKPSKPDESVTPPDELAAPYAECWQGNRRACFAEPQAAIGGTGLGLSFLALPPGGGSEPWVACAQYGCCCGGTGCHRE